MQLINTSVYDKETQARSKAMEETRRRKAARRDDVEKQKMRRYLQTRVSQPAQATPSSALHEILIDGLRFQVLNGGSKLLRNRGEILVSLGQKIPSSKETGVHESGTSTPKQAVVGGVTFFRSKNGNLYRSGLVKAKK